MRTRADWDPYFLDLARAVAARADCTRRQVGCVIVDADHRVLATGYNGSAPGGPSCLAGQCPRGQSGVLPGSSYDTGPGSCISTHAEINAILFARTSLKGATLYCTDEPCGGCARIIASAQVARVVVP